MKIAKMKTSTTPTFFMEQSKSCVPPGKRMPLGPRIWDFWYFWIDPSKKNDTIWQKIINFLF